MKASDNYTYDGVGYNGPHLAKMDYPQFKKEVSHHFTGDDAETKMQELHGKLKAKFPPPVTLAPASPVVKS